MKPHQDDFFAPAWTGDGGPLAARAPIQFATVSACGVPEQGVSVSGQTDICSGARAAVRAETPRSENAPPAHFILTDTAAPYCAGSPTSKAASASIDAGGAASLGARQRERVLAFLRAAGQDGATDEEGQIALSLAGHSYCPRRIQLMQQGLVKLTSLRRDTKSGRQAGVYVAMAHALSP